MIRSLSVAAALMLATPVFAQTAPAQTAPAPSAAAPAPSTDDAETAFDAKAEAFGARMEAMQGEMSAAATAAGTDTAKRDADLDAIEARYQPDVDTFIADLQAFVAVMAPTVAPEQAQGMQAGVDAGIAQIRGVTGQVRAAVLQQAAAAPAAQ